VARLAGGDEVDGVDEEFLFHLNRGSDLLSRGDAEAAKTSLERALELRPKDAKVLGLLGQAFYKLGEFDDATIAWERLVDENPVEPAARVNLGLAFLKAKRHPEAKRQLEIALDLNPDHKKAMGYLGLVLLELGDTRAAREWFVQAGSEQMAARCDEILAGTRPAPTMTPVPESAPAGAVEPAEPVEPAEAAEQPAPPPEPIGTPLPGAFAAVRAAPAAMAPAASARGPWTTGEAPSLGEPGLAGWAAARLWRPAVGEVFAAGPGVLAVAVRGAVRVRLDGLFATRGRVAVAGELKRFRGRETDKPFGAGGTRMHRANGDGALLFQAKGRRFTALDLGADAAYLREEVVFAFEDGIAFENGRVPSQSAVELNLVHLRGRGRFLLVTAGEPVAMDVTADAPLRVPLPALVGWLGALTPRVTALLEEGGDPTAAGIELVGDGRVLLDPAAVGPAVPGEVGA
jgi:uncharacterized protein (AIM24 family)